MSADSLEARAAALFPNSVAMQTKWIAARRAADKIGPKWSKLVPLSIAAIPKPEQQFCVRSMREVA